MMDEALFWSLIARLDWEHTGDHDAVLQPLIDALARLPEEAIFRFDDLLSEKLYALDGEAYARQIGQQSFGARGDGPAFSPERFLHARCCAVANGRELFLKALFDPSRMPKDRTFAALLQAASRAYAKKTGLEYDHVPEMDIETGSNPVGWARAERA